MVNSLEKLAKIQLNHPLKIVGLAFLMTIVFAAGIPKIQLNTDFQDSLPDDIDAIEAQDKVENNFGSSNSIIILFKTNKQPKEESFVTDVRDKRNIQTLKFLKSELEKETVVESTSSMADLFEGEEVKGNVKKKLDKSDASFTNRDFTATTMFVELSEDMTEENIREANKVIEENIQQAPKYPGVDITLTGTPVVRTTLSNVLVSDTVFTIAIASVLILLLLTISRGIFYGPATFVPLFVGLIWTLGFMGHLGIPLSFATISLGSMILGLGVEYGSFITERILEEMKEHSIEEAVTITIPNTGKAILGSAMTDGLGFMALLLASFAFIRELGITLALGEFLTVSSALIISPCLMISYRRWKDDRLFN